MLLSITPKEFTRIADYIYSNYGIHMKKEKAVLLVGRLSSVLQQLHIDNFSDYFDYIVSDPSGQALTTFVNKITTNHTFFMREPEHFQFMNEQVLPSITGTVPNKDLRIWSAGCSTGEEPYTLAMLIHEYLGLDYKSWDSKILATDISERALREAKEGIYDSAALGLLPNRWKSTYFNKCEGGQVAINDTMKNGVVFRRFNLMERIFPFKRKFHVIFCRNVMIYFDNKTKTQLIQKFHNCLVPGGYLFIGQSETINRDQFSFKYIMPAVYRKI